MNTKIIFKLKSQREKPTQCTTLIGMACRTFDFIFNLKRRQLLKFKIRGLKNLRDLDAVRVGQTPAFFTCQTPTFFTCQRRC